MKEQNLNQYKNKNKQFKNTHENSRFKNDSLSVEAAAESPEGLGGSSAKLGNNIINKEQYFRERSKQTINLEELENMLEEKNL